MDLSDPALESILKETLQKAASLQKLDPEQALLLAGKVIEQAERTELHYYHAAALKVAGNVYFLRKVYDIAANHYQPALSIAKKANDPKLSGDILYNLGRVFTGTKDYHTALQYLQESLSLRSKLPDKTDVIISLNHIGQVYWELQDYQEAITHYLQATEHCDASTNARLTAALYNNLGNAYIKIEEIPKAMEAYTYSLKLKETFGDAADLATANLNLGNLYYTTTDYNLALGYYQEARKLYARAGDKAKEAFVYSNMGATYSALNELEQAALCHNKALKYFKQNNLMESYAKALNSIGNIYHLQAEYQKAIDFYQESLELKNTLHNPEGLAITYSNLSESCYCLGEYQAAMDNTRKAMGYANQIGLKTILLKSYAQLGKIFAALNDFHEAYEALNSYRVLDLELEQTEKRTMLAEMMAHYDAEGKSKQIASLKSEQHNLEEMLSQQVKDKLRYLKLYRSKREEVKKRVAAQAKLEQLNSELETRITNAIYDYQAQQQIITQKSKLESLGVMAAGMAHEINQPLSAISMSISNLLIKARKGEITDTYLDDKIRKITADIQRIRNVIEHVRLFSRDQIQNTPELIDIHQALRDAVSMIMYDLTKHQIKLRLHLSEIPLFSVGSKYKLEQVFLNLISNARDAIREKQEGSLGQEALIEISTLKVGEQAEIVFRDNGIGMSEAGIVKMFDPFYTTKSPDQGTGLGLSISYGIIREMNGQILVSSEPGVYTHVTIMIPNLEERK